MRGNPIRSTIDGPHYLSPSSLAAVMTLELLSLVIVRLANKGQHRENYSWLNSLDHS